MRDLYIPNGGGPPRILPCRDDCDEVVITRRADCGPVEEVYRWDVESVDFRLAGRRRMTQAEWWGERKRFLAASTRTS